MRDTNQFFGMRPSLLLALVNNKLQKSLLAKYYALRARKKRGAYGCK